MVIRSAKRTEVDVIKVKVVEVSIGSWDDRTMLHPHNDALVIMVDVAGVWVTCSFVDNESLIDIMY